MKKILPWQEISRENVFSKYGRKIDKVIFKLPTGQESDFYLTGKDDRVVAVFALTPDNQVILVEEFRPGPQKILSELPGGGVDKAETPLEAIKREFLEESGYTGDFEFVTESIIDAYSGATRYHFVAKNCRKIQEPADTDVEFTNVVLMNLDQFKKYLKIGQLSDIATAYYGLEHLDLL
ncbi:MAG: NUDIX hydrolase [Candidatus Shapirobacteria bacterium]|jgi:ADP-ribose pyrophosphatase